jgi:hypothetical protein
MPASALPAKPTENQVREIEAAGFQVGARRVVAETVSGSSAIGVSVEAAPAIDVTEFLWASLALFDDEQPGPPHRLHSIATSRLRLSFSLAQTFGAR